MAEDEKRLTDLVHEIQKGHLEAFDELYSLTSKPVFFSGMAVIHDEESVKDLMQDTYADFLKNIASIKNTDTVTAYLCRSIHNKAINMAKSQEKEVLIDAYDNEDMYGGSEDEHEDDKVFFEKVRRLVTEEEYEIVIQHSVNELKFKDIAKIVHKPLGTVLWLYNRAMKKLQKGLGEEL
jgi:RNA polymerase sigma-70 factor (ECF subfamily)